MEWTCGIYYNFRNIVRPGYCHNQGSSRCRRRSQHLRPVYTIMYRFQISTLATKLGVRNIAFLGSGLLLVNYVAAVLATIYMPQAFRRSLMIPAHVFLALCFIFQTRVLEQAKYTKEAISGFYRFIWNLFYAEYAIFPFL